MHVADRQTTDRQTDSERIDKQTDGLTDRQTDGDVISIAARFLRNTC